MIARLQFWLQGHVDKNGRVQSRPWVSIALGNRISDLRYWIWRLRGGEL